jgi:hypothetical protein
VTARLVPVASASSYDSEAAGVLSEGWPEFIFHDAGVSPYVERRAAYFADLDFYLLDQDRLVGGCWAVPVRWDGTVADLPSGYTSSLARAVDGHEAGVVPDTLVVMAAAIRSGLQGRGLAGVALTGLRSVAASVGLARVIAPVRPTLKSQYPLTPIETFMTWTRPDGSPLDPWVRTHARLGATVLAAAPRSQTITGTVADWEAWTGLALPSSGAYVIPGGLSVLHIDGETGTYHEPNIWMRHV